MAARGNQSGDGMVVRDCQAGQTVTRPRRVGQHAKRGLTREQVMTDVLLAAQPTKRFVTPEEVADLAVFLCSEGARSITGANLSMDGGWTAA